VIRVAAAAIVEDGRLLLVSKRAAPSVYYLPGGKPDPAETVEDCVRREVREELGAELTSLAYLETVVDVAALERVPMSMDVFVAALDRAPRVASEIAALAWFRPDEPFAGTLAPAVANGVVPGLRDRSLL
jgi:8-oxo-dGTP pyrophosphatase MutT (NUDIX family)